MKIPSVLIVIVLAFASFSPADSKELTSASSLNLIPFPKQAQMQEGQFNLQRKLILETNAKDSAVLFTLLSGELQRAGYKHPQTRTFDSKLQVVNLLCDESVNIVTPSFRENATAQDYILTVQPKWASVYSPSVEGLLYGAQTLCQLIRANREGNSISCLSVADWPSIPWRAFQNDLTRGPSSKLDFLKREIDLCSYLKMNIFTYYMEYQYIHEKHPKIGPEDGSLAPNELRQMVEYAAPRGVNIMGNQQSFGHFEKILSHEEYAPLRENAAVLTPTKEETYQLLDDLFSDQIPLLPFPFFNVCCDETWGLGDGPAKTMVEQYGLGGTYVKHIQRVYDLVKKKYNKRMMMWGDIILNHPDFLKEIPKDVIMMTWGYDARDNFESQIVPFAQSGFQFFVCPGISNWSMILPTFKIANVNIQNFIRDGYKHGCLGVLNTVWDDDGRTFDAVNVYGGAWGAECSWNASTTPLSDFNRRVGAVLFGEKNGHFGAAIELLSKLDAKNNSLFFTLPFTPFVCASIEEKRKELENDELLKIVRPALDELGKCQKTAKDNADWLDYFIFGSQRLELIAQREIDRFEAAVAYQKALQSSPKSSRSPLAKAVKILQRVRDAHIASRDRFMELWNKENKPYALDWAIEGGHKVYKVQGSYNEIITQYDRLIWRLSDLMASGATLPPASELGLEIQTKAQ